MSKKVKRRDLTKEKFWREIIARQKASGKTQIAFCQDEGLGHHTLQKWKTNINKRDAEDRKNQSKKKASVIEPPEPFVRVLVPETLKPAKTNLVDDIVAEIEGGGLNVRIFRCADSVSLSSIFQALQEHSN